MQSTKQFLDQLVGKWVVVLTPHNFQHEGYLLSWDEDGFLLGPIPHGPGGIHLQRGPGTTIRQVTPRRPPPPFQQMGK